MKETYWIKTPKGKKCLGCSKPFLSRKIRRTHTGYCQVCRLKLLPPALGKKRPDMVGNKFTLVKYGKDNYFSKVKFKGDNHGMWKGDKVGYHALHTWLKRELGTPMVCEFCKIEKENGRQIHWANKSKEYKRDLTDWLRLCAKCHWHYDRDK